MVEARCTACRGEGRTPGKREIDVTIPPGTEDGMQFRLGGEGEPGDDGAARGDLYCWVHVRPHPLFERHGNDLLCSVPITVAQAALGTAVEVPTLDGPTTVKIPPERRISSSFAVSGSGS